MENPIKLYHSLDEFVKYFDENFESFKRMHKDSSINDFLDEYELKIKDKLNGFNNSAGSRLRFDLYDSGTITEPNPYKEKLALKAILRHVQDKRNISPTLPSNDKEYKNIITPIQWKGTSTELTALIKSLRESNKLEDSLNEKQIVERFEKFFVFPLKGYDQTKTKIRNRINDQTPFIDKLKENLEHWIRNKD